MRNMSSWEFGACSIKLHRSIKGVSYIVTRPGMVYSERHDVLTQVLMKIMSGEGLWTFGWNVVPSSWTVGPEDEGTLTSRQGKTSQIDLNLHQHRCENFTVTNCCPETSVRNYQFTLFKIPKECDKTLVDLCTFQSKRNKFRL
jgi:hypothetical protein